jgi:hypothetical protein
VHIQKDAFQNDKKKNAKKDDLLSKDRENIKEKKAED